jgi:hypothetical protein
MRENTTGVARLVSLIEKKLARHDDLGSLIMVP